jgi:hypothetical protein
MGTAEEMGETVMAIDWKQMPKLKDFLALTQALIVV